MNRIFLLAMQCELLTVEGKPGQALEAGREALLLLENDNDLLYFSDFVLLRYTLAALESGDWVAAATALDRYAAGSAMGLIYFGGGIEALKGMSLLRQGRLEQATELLTPAVEALRVRDPLQLRGLGNAWRSMPQPSPATHCLPGAWKASSGRQPAQAPLWKHSRNCSGLQARNFSAKAQACRN